MGNDEEWTIAQAVVWVCTRDETRAAATPKIESLQALQHLLLKYRVARRTAGDHAIQPPEKMKTLFDHFEALWAELLPAADKEATWDLILFQRQLRRESEGLLFEGAEALQQLVTDLLAARLTQ